MNYDRIILEMLDRIKTLENEVATLKKAIDESVVESKAIVRKDDCTLSDAEAVLPKVGKAYAKVSEYLADSSKDKIELTLDEIEELIESKLPDSAPKHRVFLTKKDVSTLPNAEEIKPKVGKKYAKLSEYLIDSGKDRIELSFDEIEKIIETKLPNSARKHRAFWANTASHTIAFAWMDFNYITIDVDTEKGNVVFERTKGTRISDHMETFVDSGLCWAEDTGEDCVMTLENIREGIKNIMGINPMNIIPDEFCYNRISSLDRNSLSQPMLLEYLEDGTYKFLGRYYPYYGKVYFRPKGADKDIIVGYCEDGKRYITEA